MPARRRSFKSTPFKRKFVKKSSTGKGRKAYVRKKRYGAMGSFAKKPTPVTIVSAGGENPYHVEHKKVGWLPVEQALPNVAKTIMVTSYMKSNYPPLGTSASWTASTTTACAQLYLSANDLYSPGTNNIITSFAPPPCSGYATVSNDYFNWQVTEAECCFTITAENAYFASSGGNPAIFLCLTACSDSVFAAFPTDWNTILKQPESSPIQSIGPMNGTMPPGQIQIKMRRKLRDIETDPYYWLIPSRSTGIGSVAPTKYPSFVLSWLMPNSVTGGFFQVQADMKFHVTWRDRRPTSLSRVLAPVPGAAEELARKEAEAREEGKEEKKESKEEEKNEGPDESGWTTPDVSTLSLSPIPLVRTESKALIKPALTSASSAKSPTQCLNAAHPRIGHAPIASCKFM